MDKHKDERKVEVECKCEKENRNFVIVGLNYRPEDPKYSTISNNLPVEHWE